MSKRKRVVLSLDDKIHIIESLQKGETGRNLAAKYGVATSTISDIKKKTDSIVKFICKLNSDDRSKHRKAMRKANNEHLEEALYRWYLQNRSSGRPISGPLLCKKALQLNKKIGGNKSFVASNGWLYRYKFRYGIQDLGIQSKTISPNVVNSFQDRFKIELEENDYDLDFVYNAAETILNWKLLPSKDFASQTGDSAPAYKTIEEDRVTILVCANATGTHKISLLLLGKSKNSKSFKNIKIPLIYKNHKSSWMDTDIFIDWYDSTFITEVKKYQNQIGKQGNVLLMLTNTPIHSSANLLERENGMFKVKLLPSDVAPLLEPMSSIITTLKQLYRQQLLRRLLSVEEEAEVVSSFSKQINIKECCYMVADAWDFIEKDNLSKAWNKILKRENEDFVTNEDDIVEDIHQLIASIQICQDCNADDVKAWLDCDSNDQDYEMLSKDVIVDDMLLENKNQEVKEEKIEEREDEIEVNLSPENDVGPSHLEAFQALETAFKWYERQTECDTVSLMQLKKILDLAATKSNNS